MLFLIELTTLNISKRRVIVYTNSKGVIVCVSDKCDNFRAPTLRAYVQYTYSFFLLMTLTIECLGLFYFKYVV